MNILLTLLLLLFPSTALAGSTTSRLGLTKMDFGELRFDQSYNATIDLLDAHACFDNVDCIMQLGLATVTFAGLGTPIDGTLRYCTDCTRTDPCAGSGSGAVAERIAGVWECGGGGGGVPGGANTQVQFNDSGVFGGSANMTYDKLVGTLALQDPGAGTDLYTCRVLGDPNPRLIINADGSIDFGSGSAAPDVTLERLTSDVLGTPAGDSLVAGNILGWGGVGGGNFSSSGSPATVSIAETDTGNVTYNFTNSPGGVAAVQRDGIALIAVGDTDTVTTGMLDDAADTPAAGECLKVASATSQVEYTTCTDTNSGIFNVTDFGAVCDGTTDDTVAIQKAIDTAVGHCTIALTTSCVQDDDCPAAETCVKTHGIVQLPAATCKVGGAKHCSYSTGTTCTVSTDCPKHCASPDDPDICTVGTDCPGNSCVDYETCTTAIVMKPGVTFRGVRGFADGAGGSIIHGTQGTGDAVISLHQRLRDNDVLVSPWTISDMAISQGDWLIESLDHATFVVLKDLALSTSTGAQIHLQGCNEEWYVSNVQMSGCNPGFGSEDVIIPNSTCASTLFDKSYFENVRFTGGTNAINVDFTISASVHWNNTIFNFMTEDFVVATGGSANWVWTNTNAEGVGFFSTEDTYAKGDMTSASAQLDNLGSCSEDATKNCNVDSDCTGTCQEPLGQCSVTTSTSCRVDSECPASETCTAAFAVGDVVTVHGAGTSGKDLTGTVLSLCGTGPRTCVTLDTAAGTTVTDMEATDALYSTIKLTDTHTGGTAPSNWTFIGGSYGSTGANQSSRYAVDVSKGAAMRFYGTSTSRPVYDPGQSAIVVGGATNLRQPASLSQSTFQTVVIPGGLSPTNSNAPRSFIPSPPGKDIVFGLRDSLGSSNGTYGAVKACQLNPNRNCTWEARATSPLLNDVGSTWIRGPLIYNGSSFANLGTPGNGMEIYCNDCERTDPCQNGHCSITTSTACSADSDCLATETCVLGTGAIARRLNGRWLCGDTSPVPGVVDVGAISGVTVYGTDPSCSTCVDAGAPINAAVAALRTDPNVNDVITLQLPRGHLCIKTPITLEGVHYVDRAFHAGTNIIGWGSSSGRIGAPTGSTLKNCTTAQPAVWIRGNYCAGGSDAGERCNWDSDCAGGGTCVGEPERTVFRDFGIRCDDPTTQDGVACESPSDEGNATNMMIQNCHAGWRVSNMGCFDFDLDHMFFHANEVGYQVDGTANAGGLISTISHSIFRQSVGGKGRGIDSGNGSEIQVNTSLFESLPDGAIHTQGQPFITVRNSHFEGNGSATSPYDMKWEPLICSTCVGGANIGLPCASDAGCPGSTCDLTPTCSSVCKGGTNDNTICTTNADCTGPGVCTGKFCIGGPHNLERGCDSAGTGLHWENNTHSSLGSGATANIILDPSPNDTSTMSITRFETALLEWNVFAPGQIALQAGKSFGGGSVITSIGNRDGSFDFCAGVTCDKTKAYNGIVCQFADKIKSSMASSGVFSPGCFHPNGTLGVNNGDPGFDSQFVVDNNDTTPSIAEGTVFLTANTAATMITQFDDGVTGQKIVLIAGDPNTTIKENINIHLAGPGGHCSTTIADPCGVDSECPATETCTTPVDFVMKQDDTIALVQSDTNEWSEISRSSGASTSASAHNILSSVHTDTTGAGTEVSGDLLRRGTSAWERLPIGASGDVLSVVSGAPAWSTPASSVPGLLHFSTMGTFAGNGQIYLGGTVSATENNVQLLIDRTSGLRFGKLNCTTNQIVPSGSVGVSARHGTCGALADDISDAGDGTMVCFFSGTTCKEPTATMAVLTNECISLSVAAGVTLSTPVVISCTIERVG